MSRILKLNLNYNFNFFVFNFSFLKKNHIFKKKSYFYFDYFFYLLLIKNCYSYAFFKNLKIFLNFFQNYLNTSNKFIILDYNQYFMNMFNNLLFSNLDLIKYNYFFKFNLKLLKYQHFYYLFSFFLKKFNINMLVILDHKTYHTFFPYFNNMNLCLFSFVDSLKKTMYLDFFYFYSLNYLNLEKIFFLSKLLQFYNLYCYTNFKNNVINLKI